MAGLLALDTAGTVREVLVMTDSDQVRPYYSAGIAPEVRLSAIAGYLFASGGVVAY